MASLNKFADNLPSDGLLPQPAHSANFASRFQRKRCKADSCRRHFAVKEWRRNKQHLGRQTLLVDLHIDYIFQKTGL